MRAKHNKKRNTAFLYEVLTRELTKSLINNASERAYCVKEIIKEFFCDQQVLGRELSCFRPLLETVEASPFAAEKIILESKKRYSTLTPSEIFSEQSRLIKRINNDLGQEVYNHFVPNYRSFATVAQIFSSKTPISHQVLLEEKIAKSIIRNEKPEELHLEATDSLVVKSFVERFNQEYGMLLPEQKQLLQKYITSFGDSKADFQLYVGNELKNLKEAIALSLELDEVKADAEMTKTTHQVLEKINNINVANMGSAEILTLLKLQTLASEYHTDAD